jgi:acetamidase/formamidase
MPAVHRLDAEPGAVRDVFSCEVPAALTVAPGDSLVVHTLDASGHLARQRTPGEERPRMFPTGRGHCLAGPIAVRGARPGQLLSVRFEALRPDGWGYTSAGGRDNVLNRMLGTELGQPAHLLWELDADAGVGVNQHGMRVPLAPFLGVVGVAPDAVGEYSTIPPRTVGGGNIDCRGLTAGATLYLPVAVPDAFLFLGDGHAAQGDGEVGGTAIECGMTTELTVGLHDAGPLHSVHAVTPSSRITFGFSPDLNAATGVALAAMLTWMQQLLDVDRHTALALASVVVDLRITQVANQTWGVHAVLPAEVVDGR